MLQSLRIPSIANSFPGKVHGIAILSELLKTESLSCDRLSVFLERTVKLHGQGVADAVEGVVDLLAEGAHNGNHDDGDERENDRVLNQTLTFFLGSE